MRHKINTLLVLFITLISVTTVQAATCNMPDRNCLLRHIEKLIQALPDEIASKETLVTHWNFERDKQYLRPLPRNNQNALLRQLYIEEAFINDLKNNTVTSTLASNANFVFHDTLQANGRLLRIQALTLELQDQSAKEVTRIELESIWSPDKTPNAQLLNIARHEIVGGNPVSGLNTLATTELNEFSDIKLLTEYSSLKLIGLKATELFLNPTAANSSCERDELLILDGIGYFYSADNQRMLTAIWNAPELKQAWKSHLSLILLYRNAGVCSILIELHEKALIQSTLNVQQASENMVLNLIYLARALRRYV